MKQHLFTLPRSEMPEKAPTGQPAVEQFGPCVIEGFEAFTNEPLGKLTFPTHAKNTHGTCARCGVRL